MIKLIIEDDEGKTTVVPLIRDEVSIGRKEGNTIRLTERNVSRRHARLVRSNGTVFIEDLDSYNGIKVNGTKIAGRVAVTEGDRIQIGDYVLGLKLEGAAAQTTKPKEDAGDGKPSRSELRTTELTAEERAAADDATRELDQQELADAARLACVSANFAGMEFTLHKSTMVLGRTDDNDVVINHRSISRHHCRVVEENGRFTIIDLQSANGVRVNGEEYGKVELRRGDLIDLGHVRLRFVAPGEDFVFERDATVVDTTKPSGSGGGIWLGVALVALLTVGFFVWRAVSAPDEGGDRLATDGGHATGTTPATPGEDQPPNAEQLKLVSSIESAMHSESWALVGEHCAKLAGQAKLLAARQCDQGRAEQQWKKTFEEANAKTTTAAFVDALELFNRIPDSSIYAAKRAESPSYKEAREKYLAQMLQAVEADVAAGDCTKASEKADAVKQLIPDETQIQTKAAACTPTAPPPPDPLPRPKTKVRPPGSLVVKRPPPAKKPPPPPAAPTPEQLQQADEWLQQARKAYINGQYAQAITIAKKVLKVPTKYNAKAWQIVGASACYTKNMGLARKAHGRVSAQERQLLRTVCSRVGISL